MTSQNPEHGIEITPASEIASIAEPSEAGSVPVWRCAQRAVQPPAMFATPPSRKQKAAPRLGVTRDGVGEAIAPDRREGLAVRPESEQGVENPDGHLQLTGVSTESSHRHLAEPLALG